MIEKIKKDLLNSKDEKYKNFSSSLLPNINNIIGIRLPKLKKLAKEISKNNYEDYFKENDDEFFELTMLEGMIIGFLDKDFNTIEKYIKNFIEKINNWSVCDSFCAGLKIIKNNKNKIKPLLEECFNSGSEFKIRFGFVVLLNYYIDDDFNYVIEKLQEFNSDYYYAKMAGAWCLSICLIKKYDETIKEIKTKKFHNFIFNKGLSKAIESYRLSQKQKEELRNLKILLLK